MHTNHQGALFTQLVAQRVGQRPGSGLGHRINTGARQRNPAQYRQHVDQCTTAIAGEYRCKRTTDGQHTVDVGLHQVAQRIYTAIGQQRFTAYGHAGIVDQQINVTALRHRSSNVCCTGNVELDRHHTFQRDGGRIPRAGIDLFRTGGQECLGISQTESAIGTGYQCRAAFDFHECLP